MKHTTFVSMGVTVRVCVCVCIPKCIHVYTRTTELERQLTRVLQILLYEGKSMEATYCP